MLLVGNGVLITRDGENSVIKDGCVAAADGLVTETGTTGELKTLYPEAEFIDARGGLIMPGFINTHHHIYSAFARGLSVTGHSPRNFSEILRGLWWRLDSLLDIEDTRMSAMSTYIDCIRMGVTTVFDHHASYSAISGSLAAIADAAAQIGVRTCLCYEVSDRCGEASMRQAVHENAEFIKSACTDMLRGMTGLHASFTLSDATLDYCRENTPEDIGFHIHVAEGAEDLQDSLEKYGQRVVNRLYRRGILGSKTIAAHCIHVDDGETELLLDTNTAVVHNPESNMGNAVGCPPAVDMVKRGVLVGLGTDGYTSDMLESYKAANCLHKHALKDPAAAWTEVPQMLFAGNAEIAQRHFGRKLGVLEKGAAADIIVAEYDPPAPLDASNYNAHLLFGLSGRDVTTTVVDGQVLMRDRRLTRHDHGEIMAKCRERASALWSRINQ